MIEKKHNKVSITEQCRLLALNRSTICYKPSPPIPDELKIKIIMDKLFLEKPYLGSRGITKHLRRQGFIINRKRTR